jgi:hypothetical protein
MEISGYNLEYYSGITKPLSFSRTLLEYLSMGPDIAPIAHTFWYEINDFVLDIRNGVLTAPNPSLRPNIRRLEVQLSRVNRPDWAALQKLAAGGYGFENVRHVSIEIVSKRACHQQELHAFFHLLVHQPIGFSCAGEVSYPEDWDDRDLVDVDEAITNNIHFGEGSLGKRATG